MQTSLRKMGNSIGMIVPRTMLAEIGAANGTRFDLKVEAGRIVASPVVEPIRAGWEVAAAALAADGEDDVSDWSIFGNEGDDALTW